jgi:hypothetical protein
VRLCICGTGPLTGPVSIPRWHMSEYGAALGWYWPGKTGRIGEKLVPVPLCPAQIPHGLTWSRTSACAVRVRRLTAWAMVQPSGPS